jgi:hypothetical protein
MGNPKISFGVFFLLLSTNPNTLKRSGFSEFKALATDMAFASTPYIKAGIDLFSFSQTKSV